MRQNRFNKNYKPKPQHEQLASLNRAYQYILKLQTKAYTNASGKQIIRSQKCLLCKNKSGRASRILSKMKRYIIFCGSLSIKEKRFTEYRQRT